MNSDDVAFSIIIPLYNKEAYIKTTIASVLNQTHQRFELIVVNDGSTDQSLCAASVYQDTRIRIFTKINGGVSDARNYGIARTQFNYIAFLDADDTWEQNYLEEMALLISKYPECSMFSSAYRIVKQNISLVACSEVPEGTIDDFFQLRLKSHIMRTSATVVKKNAFDDVGGFPVGMIGGEDDYTWTKIALKYKAAFIPKPLVNYNYIYSTINTRKGKLDSCKESWFDFYEEGNFYKNEFVASKAIHAGIRYALGSPFQRKSIEIERKTRFTVLSKAKWRYLYVLNRAPNHGIKLYLNFKNLYRASKGWIRKQIINIDI